MSPATTTTTTTTKQPAVDKKKSILILNENNNFLNKNMCLTSTTIESTTATSSSSSSTIGKDVNYCENNKIISKNSIQSSSSSLQSVDNKNENMKIIEHNNNNNKSENIKKLYYNENLINNHDDYKEFKPQIRWPDLLVQIFIHAGFIYGLYLLFYIKFQTFIWFIALIIASGFGITAGAHRLWSHKSYKAKLPLRLLLIFLFTIAGQRDAYTWALDHRIHHKYSETDADPHNAKRGFFFAHVAWLFLTPHPKVVEKRKVIDMSDLENDKVVMWQKKMYIPLFALLAIAFPVIVPWYYWNENLWISFWVNFNCRFCTTLNIAFFVNSVAHMWGKRPYDKNISPVENISVAIAALGEGWHNYHHVFPWDYKTGEFGDYKLNITTAFIDTFAKIGWAFDRKIVSSAMIARRAAKCGDGTHFLNDELAHKNQVWGYGDKDISKEDEAELEAMQN